MSGFGSASVGFRVLQSVAGLPVDWMERMAARALPALGELEEQVHGWCGWRHAQDRCFTDDGLVRGGYPTGLLVVAERKIPASTLAAECALEEMAEMQAEGKSYLNMQARSEIKKSVKERLLPVMPVTFSGVEWVFVENGEPPEGGTTNLSLVFCTAVSVRALDAFVLAWMQTFGEQLRVLDAAGLALAGGHLVLDWLPVAFSDQSTLFCDGCGREFLMWLWHFGEKRGGTVNVPGCGEFAFMLDGPLVLAGEGKTVRVASAKATLDAETCAALVDGLVLDRCRFTVVRGDEVWNCTLDSGFVFRGMKTPSPICFDAHERFAERVAFLALFQQVFAHLFGLYCRERSEPGSGGWKNTVFQLNGWISGKALRHGNGMGSDKSLGKPNAEVSTAKAQRRKDETGKGNGREGTQGTQKQIDTCGLGELARAVDLVSKLEARREELQSIMHVSYQDRIEPYMRNVRSEMIVFGTSALKSALSLANDYAKDGADAVVISCQLVAGLEVSEEIERQEAEKTDVLTAKTLRRKPETGKVKLEKVDDELIEQAIEVIRMSGRASTSSLQRRLRIGYNRASKIMDVLEERGIVGPPVGDGVREVLAIPADLPADLQRMGCE